MKTIKRLLLVVFMFTLTFMLFVKSIGLKVQAETTKFQSVDKQTEWEVTEEVKRNIGGMTQTEIYGKSKSNTFASCQAWGDQHVNILEMKTDGVNSKLVSWGVHTGTKGLTFASLTSIAKDYEKNHPGWLVLGGVNGDQYYMSYGNGKGVDGSWYTAPVPYYPLKIDGETRYPITPYNVSSSNYLGVLNNGQPESFARAGEVDKLMLEIIDENGKVLSSYPVDKVNQNATGNEVSVWISYPNPDTKAANASATLMSVTATTSSNLYIVEIPELAYVVNLNATLDKTVRDCLFGRGVISKIDKTYTFGGNLNKKEEYEIANGFGIETANKEITDKLNVNTRIRVQYTYKDETLNNCESFMNFHSIQVFNGETVHADQGYDSSRYNRSGWGRKADGTYVLFAGAKGNYAGLSQDETNTLLLKYGVVEAYQQDGGGSAMCIVRNMVTGDFDVVQPSSDGTGKGQRSVAEACLFVVRDPSVEIQPTNVTYHSVKFTKKEVENLAVSNMKITMNGNTYDFTDECTIDGLDPETTYDYTINYDFDNNGTTGKGKFQGYISTHKMEFPAGIVRFKEASTEEAIFDINDSSATNIIVNINRETFRYSPNDNKQLVVTGLQKEETYLYTYQFDILNQYNNKTYTFVSNEESLETPKFVTPKIAKFELEKTTENYVRVACEYTDPDRVVEKAYVVCENNIYELLIKNDSVKIDDLDLAHKEYKIQLFVEYEGNTIESDIITVGTNYEEPPAKTGCSGAVIVYLVASLLFVSAIYYKKH